VDTTAVIGSTPLVSTSSSCLTQSRMPDSSFSSALASASVTLMRASRAMRRTVRLVDLHGSSIPLEYCKIAPHS
jgi:hypothetical protein